MERTRISKMAPWELPEVEPLFPPRSKRAQPRSRLPFHFRGARPRAWLPWIAGALALATGLAAWAAHPRLPDFRGKAPAIARTAKARAAAPAVTARGTTRRSNAVTVRPARRATSSRREPSPGWVVPGEATSAPEPAVAELLEAGHIWFRTGKFDRAEDVYRQALSREDGEARFWLGAAEWKQGKRWRACRHFRLYLDRFPDGPRADSALGGTRACEREQG